MGDSTKLRILMVCMGNICRSPTAEGVLRDHLRRAGLEARVEIDSAGTHGYHVGRPPDPRAIGHALARGIDLRDLRARQVTPADFDRFDRIYAMDEDNLSDLALIRPAGSRAELALLLDVLADPVGREVPDPYIGSPGDFERVLDLTERAAQALVQQLTQALGTDPWGT